MKIQILYPSIIVLLSQSCSLVAPTDSSHSYVSFDSASFPTTEIATSHDYEEVKDRHIYWSNIFTRNDDAYLVYLYSLTCSHCNAIKNTMIEFALSNVFPIYFVTSSPEVTISQSLAEKQNVSSITELGIRGYPTILYLVEHTVTLNVAGEKPILDALDYFYSN